MSDWKCVVEWSVYYSSQMPKRAKNRSGIHTVTAPTWKQAMDKGVKHAKKLRLDGCADLTVSFMMEPV